MPRVKSERQSATKHRVRPPENFDEYLATVAPQARSALVKMRAAIRSVLPREASETISYRIPAFRHKGIVVWFAAFSSHCSLFPTASVIEEYRAKLKGYKTSKGTVQFPLEKPLPVALIKAMVKSRLTQLESKPRK